MMELEIFEENFLKRKLPTKKRERVIENLSLIKNIFTELFIMNLDVPSNKVFTHFEFDVADLIRDVVYLYTMRYFKKEEVVHLLNNLNEESIIESFYQRI
jgi:hypothetical protein